MTTQGCPKKRSGYFGTQVSYEIHRKQFKNSKAQCSQRRNRFYGADITQWATSAWRANFWFWSFRTEASKWHKAWQLKRAWGKNKNMLERLAISTNNTGLPIQDKRQKLTCLSASLTSAVRRDGGFLRASFSEESIAGVCFIYFDSSKLLDVLNRKSVCHKCTSWVLNG